MKKWYEKLRGGRSNLLSLLLAVVLLATAIPVPGKGVVRAVDSTIKQIIIKDNSDGALKYYFPTEGGVADNYELFTYANGEERKNKSLTYQSDLGERTITLKDLNQGYIQMEESFDDKLCLENFIWIGKEESAAEPSVHTEASGVQPVLTKRGLTSNSYQIYSLTVNVSSVEGETLNLEISQPKTYIMNFSQVLFSDKYRVTSMDGKSDYPQSRFSQNEDAEFKFKVKNNDTRMYDIKVTTNAAYGKDGAEEVLGEGGNIEGNTQWITYTVQVDSDKDFFVTAIDKTVNVHVNSAGTAYEYKGKLEDTVVAAAGKYTLTVTPKTGYGDPIVQWRYKKDGDASNWKKVDGKDSTYTIQTEDGGPFTDDIEIKIEDGQAKEVRVTYSIVGPDGDSEDFSEWLNSGKVTFKYGEKVTFSVKNKEGYDVKVERIVNKQGDRVVNGSPAGDGITYEDTLDMVPYAGEVEYKATVTKKVYKVKIVNLANRYILDSNTATISHDGTYSFSIITPDSMEEIAADKIIVEEADAQGNKLESSTHNYVVQKASGTGNYYITNVQSHILITIPENVGGEKKYTVTFRQPTNGGITFKYKKNGEWIDVTDYVCGDLSHGGEFEFQVIISEHFDIPENFGMRVDGTAAALSPESTSDDGGKKVYEYKLEGITANQVIDILNPPTRKNYKVTAEYETVEEEAKKGIEISFGATTLVAAESELKFRVTLNEVICDTSKFEVKAVEKEQERILHLGEDGYYTIDQVLSDTTIKICNVERRKYKITFSYRDLDLTIREGENPEEGQELIPNSPVEVKYGEDYSFAWKFKLPGDRFSTFTVGGEPVRLEASVNTYTIKEIDRDLTVIMQTEGHSLKVRLKADPISGQQQTEIEIKSGDFENTYGERQIPKPSSQLSELLYKWAGWRLVKIITNENPDGQTPQEDGGYIEKVTKNDFDTAAPGTIWELEAVWDRQYQNSVDVKTELSVKEHVNEKETARVIVSNIFTFTQAYLENPDIMKEIKITGYGVLFSGTPFKVAEVQTQLIKERKIETSNPEQGYYYCSMVNPNPANKEQKLIYNYYYADIDLQLNVEGLKHQFNWIFTSTKNEGTRYAIGWIELKATRDNETTIIFDKDLKDNVKSVTWPQGSSPSGQLPSIAEQAVVAPPKAAAEAETEIKAAAESEEETQAAESSKETESGVQAAEQEAVTPPDAAPEDIVPFEPEPEEAPLEPAA